MAMATATNEDVSVLVMSYRYTVLLVSLLSLSHSVDVASEADIFTLNLIDRGGHAVSCC